MNGYRLKSMELTASQLEELADFLVESHDELLEKLIKQRKDHSLSQAEVAERMGVSQPTVAAFERYDANPTLSTVRRYALAVGAAIEHRVEDRCCDFSSEVFAEITGKPDLAWQRPRAFDWAWSAGSAEVVTNANR